MITAVRHHQTLASTNDKKRRMCDRGALHKVLGVVAFVFNLFFRLEHKRESVSNFRQPEKKPATSTRRGSNNRRIVYRQNNRHHHERAITTVMVEVPIALFLVEHWNRNNILTVTFNCLL